VPLGVKLRMGLWSKVRTNSYDFFQAMNWVKNTIKDLEFPGVSFAIASSYSRWEIDEVKPVNHY
jgi:hypothetical protein